MHFLKLCTARFTAPVTKQGEDGLEFIDQSPAALLSAAVPDTTLGGKLQLHCVTKHKQRSKLGLSKIHFPAKGQQSL